MAAQIYDDALHMMELQGGSFVKALVNCYYAADSSNKTILYRAFSGYFAAYEERFRQHVAATQQAEQDK